MSATPEIEADTIPAQLMDGDNAAAVFAQYNVPAHDMQVKRNPPQGTFHTDIAAPAALSMENCGPPGGSGQDAVNGCKP